MYGDEALVVDAPPRVRGGFTPAEFMVAVEAGVFRPDERVELVRGELIRMPPEGSGHALNNSRTFRTLWRFVEGREGLKLASNMAVELNGGTVVGPDCVVFDTPVGRPSTTPASAVRLAVEHAYTSRKYDLEEKSVLYAEAAVAELWVLDDVRNVLHRFHAPENGAYRVDPPRRLDERIDIPFAPGESVQVSELFDLD